MIHVDFSMFLDRPHVMKRIAKKQRKVFYRAGAYGRSTMKNVLGKRAKKGSDGSSKPGQPPRRRTGLIRKFVYFGYDDASETVVIGPRLFDDKAGAHLHGKASVPQLLEEGGLEDLTFPDGNIETVEYLPRPFVDPIRPVVEDFYEQVIKETPL